MLNRRTLRIKAFQELYGFFQNRSASMQLSRQMVEEHFMPDLNSMEPQNKAVLNDQKQEALKIFTRQFNEIPRLEIEENISKPLVDSYNFYKTNIKREFNKLSKTAVANTLDFYQLYEKILWLLIELSDVEKKEFEVIDERIKKGIEVKHNNKLQMTENIIIRTLRENEKLNKIADELVKYWGQEQDQVTEWFKLIRKNPIYVQYGRNENKTKEEAAKFIEQLIKNIIFKNETFVSFFETNDFFWHENKTALKSMALRTIKRVVENDEDILAPISADWDDDSYFFKTLIEETVNLENENEETIAKHAQNWDIERIAMTDKILLGMALSEMKVFPSIPVKVTINEYLEIAKTYSTPKSKKFINGMLDTISKELLGNGKIRKSGKGLLDNQ